MKKKLFIGVAVAAVLVLIVVTSLKQRGSGSGIKVYEEEASLRSNLLATVEASGEVEPRVEVNISSQVPGQIIELTVDEGDPVTKNQVLVQLDPERLRSEVTRLEAQLRMAQVNVEKEMVSLRTAELNLRRLVELRRSNVVSDDQLDQAQLAVDSGRISVQAREEEVRQVDANLAKARDDLSKTTLRSPIDGIVTRLNAKVGEQVIIGTMNNPGTVILTISDMADVLAEVRVDETEITSVEPDQTVQIRVDAVHDHEYEGIVESIGNSAVREGTVSRFPVKIQFASPDDRLRPGMSAHASIEVDQRTDVLAIPLQAVVRRTLKDFNERPEQSSGSTGGVEASSEDDGETDQADKENEEDQAREQIQVVLLDRDGKVEMSRIKLGISDAFRAEVLEGVNEGDMVILGPYRRLRSLNNGDAIRKVDRDEAGEEDDED